MAQSGSVGERIRVVRTNHRARGRADKLGTRQAGRGVRVPERVRYLGEAATVEDAAETHLPKSAAGEPEAVLVPDTRAVGRVRSKVGTMAETPSVTGSDLSRRRLSLFFLGLNVRVP